MCSGVDLELLGSCPRSEDAKFAGIGGAVFFTAVMATLSAMYAVNTFVDQKGIFISVGIFWGLLIFNLDRYIVASIRKNIPGISEVNVNVYKQAIPRIALALLFAVIISKPLELAIFENEIATKLPEAGRNQAHYIQEQIDSLKNENVKLQDQVTQIEKNPIDSFTAIAFNDLKIKEKEFLDYEKLRQKDINQIQRRIDSKNADWRTVNRGIEALEILEANGTITEYQKEALASKRRNRQNIVNQISRLRKDIQKVKQEVADKKDELTGFKENTDNVKEERKETVQSRIQKLDNRISANNKLINKKEEELEEKSKNFDGILAQLEALQLLKKDKRAIQIADWLIFLLFIAVEVAPILVKIISPVGAYDKKLALVENNLSVENWANPSASQNFSGFKEKTSNVPGPFVDSVNNTYVNAKKRLLEVLIENKVNGMIEKIQNENGEAEDLIKNLINDINSAGSFEAWMASQKMAHQNGISGRTDRTNGFSGKKNQLVDNYWVTKPDGIEVRYLFKANYEFEYKKNDQVQTGTWSDDFNDDSIIEVSLNNQKKRFEIRDIKNGTLKLYNNDRIYVLKKQ